MIPALTDAGRGPRLRLLDERRARPGRPRARLLARRRDDRRATSTANMDLIAPLPVFNLYNDQWPVYTSPRRRAAGEGVARARAASRRSSTAACCARARSCPAPTSSARSSAPSVLHRPRRPRHRLDPLPGRARSGRAPGCTAASSTRTSTSRTGTASASTRTTTASASRSATTASPSSRRAATSPTESSTHPMFEPSPSGHSGTARKLGRGQVPARRGDDGGERRRRRRRRR